MCSGRVCLPRASARCILCRCGRFADAVGFLFPLCFGERIFALHLPTFVARPFIQVFLAQRVPVHRLLFPHIKQKLPSERQTCLKRCQRERTVDQDLLPCAAPRHPNVRRYWVSTDHVNDHARLYCASLRAVERVSEVGRDGKLVPGDFQLWVGAARVQTKGPSLFKNCTPESTTRRVQLIYFLSWYQDFPASTSNQM